MFQDFFSFRTLISYLWLPGDLPTGKWMADAVCIRFSRIPDEIPKLGSKGHHRRTPLYGTGGNKANWCRRSGNVVRSWHKSSLFSVPHNGGFYCRSLVRITLLYWLVFLWNIQAIAVYTFCVLVLRWNIPRYISMLVILMIWVVTALIIVIPYIVHMKEGIYGNVGYCKSRNFRLQSTHLLTFSFKGAGSGRSSRPCNWPLNIYGYGGL